MTYRLLADVFSAGIGVDSEIKFLDLIALIYFLMAIALLVASIVIIARLCYMERKQPFRSPSFNRIDLHNPSSSPFRIRHTFIR